MSDDDTSSTRPISVAELLARNGTIGAPPVGGRRRRRRGNSAAVSVAELTGEIPVIRDDAAEEPAVEAVEEVPAEDSVGGVDAVDAEMVVVYSGDAESVGATEVAEEAGATEVAEWVGATEVAEEAGATEVAEEVGATEVAEEAETAAAAAPVTEVVEVGTSRPDAVDAPPLSEIPLARRVTKPELSHDPRPLRRSVAADPITDAEQMAYDPVDTSVDLADLVGEQSETDDPLRPYLASPGGTLFGGQSVADDLARRSAGAEVAGEPAPALTSAVGPANRMALVRNAAVALLQSVLAVVFGAGLFIAFDQLWRWNNLVALVLSVLVILGLVVAVRVVRRTEDIASTLIAVAVGALVTLGPLALLQST